MQGGEAELLLRLDACRVHHPELRCLLDRAPQQRRLSAPRFAAQHEHTAGTVPSAAQHPVKRIAHAIDRAHQDGALASVR
jgi:hypothetical protein